jgi:hypothetical protein
MVMSALAADEISGYQSISGQPTTPKKKALFRVPF